MTRAVLGVALLCVLMAAALVALAWRRLGVARAFLRARPGARGSAPRRVSGALEAAGTLVLAPFTERAVLYVRATLRGVGPEGGAPRVLWEKILVAPARVRGPRGTPAVELASAHVLVPRQYRVGSLRALAPAVRLVPRVLARAGYTTPPPAEQFFALEEEVLAPGDAVTVVAADGGQEVLAPPKDSPLVVTTLAPWRVLLREAWGPALALLLALLIVLAGATAVGTWWWLR